MMPVSQPNNYSKCCIVNLADSVLWFRADTVSGGLENSVGSRLGTSNAENQSYSLFAPQDRHSVSKSGSSQITLPRQDVHFRRDTLKVVRQTTHCTALDWEVDESSFAVIGMGDVKKSPH